MPTGCNLPTLHYAVTKFVKHIDGIATQNDIPVAEFPCFVRNSRPIAGTTSCEYGIRFSSMCFWK
jgi:hypothetical protein